MAYNRVFIIEPTKTGTELGAASKYGEVRYVFDAKSRRCSMFNTDEYGRSVVHRLEQEDFDPGRDCICIVGGQIPLVVSMTAIILRWRRVRALLYDARVSEYVMRELGHESKNNDEHRAIRGANSTS